MLDRKAGALAEAMRGRPAGTVLLTNCPSCMQGLGRSRRLGVIPRHIAVELALRRSGDGWAVKLQGQVVRAQVIRF